MTNHEPIAVTIEFEPAEFDRLASVADSPADLIHEATMDRIELEEAINYTQLGGFHGPNGFAKIKEDEYPTWPFGSLLGIELQSMGGGESRWTMEAGLEHANPMGTLHGGVLCDLGDAALSTAYMSTLDDDELFTTVDLTIHFLRPVRTNRLEATGEVIHQGRSIGVSQCDIWNEDGERVARLSGTCMTLGKAGFQSD